jgi:hypothetical protein
MLYTVINKEFNDDVSNLIVNDISYSSYSSNNLERIDENNYKNNYQIYENNNKYVINDDVSHIDEYIIKNDKKHIEALFDKYIENLESNK